MNSAQRKYSTDKQWKSQCFEPANHKIGKSLSKLSTKFSTLSKNSKPVHWSLEQVQKDMKKYMDINFTRYNIKELQGFHRSLLEYAKGDIKLLRKGMTVIMNMFGILIEQQSIDKIAEQLTQTPKQLSKTVPLDEPQQTKTKNKKRITRINPIIENFSKQLQKIISEKQYNNTQHIIKSKFRKSSIIININNNTNEKYNNSKYRQIQKNIKYQLTNNITKIVQFDKFLQLYTIIQTHYFKQSIIDYLNITFRSLISTIELKEKQKSSLTIKKKKNTKMITGKPTQKHPLFLDQNRNQQAAISEQQREIGYEDIYQAFYRRSTHEKAVTIADMFEKKVKQHCKQHIKSTFYSSKTKLLSQESSFPDRENNYNIKEDWKIKIGQLYNLCYFDYQLCQTIYEFHRSNNRKNHRQISQQLMLNRTGSTLNPKIRTSILTQLEKCNIIIQDQHKYH